MNADGEQHVVVGGTGSGKSTTARALVARLLDMGFLVPIWDPVWPGSKDAWRPSGRVEVANRVELLRALHELYPREGRRIIVIRGVFYDFSPIDRLPGVAPVIDEARKFCGSNVHAPPPKGIHASLRTILGEGRHLGNPWILITQRPSQLHPDVFGNAAHVWVHRLGFHGDRRAVEDGTGVSLRGLGWKRVPGTERAVYPIHIHEGRIVSGAVPAGEDAEGEAA